MTKKKDIFDGLVLPTDEEIKNETRGRKTSQQLTGRKRPDQSIRTSGKKNPMAGKPSANKGKPMPQISEKIKGKKKPDGFGEKVSKARKELGLSNAWAGKKRPEHSERMKTNNPGLEATRTSWKCPHCKKEGTGASNYARWHGENCKENLFKDLELPSDAEISSETHRIKLAQAKKGKSGNKCSDERKRKIGLKNSVSRMSEYQRQQLIKSNKENPRHTKPHSVETKSKISKVLAKIPDYVCPHCRTTGRSGVMFRWHFDNCKHK